MNELQTLLGKPQLVCREFPAAKIPFLRFQIRKSISRAAIEPDFEGRMLVGHHQNRDGLRSHVEHLLGWGETLEAAQAMAEGKS